MTVSLKQHLGSFTTQQQIELNRLLDAVQKDVTANRTTLTGLTAKLDLDGGVTDVDYASTLDPAALILIP